MKRYSVFKVYRDGNPFDLASFDTPAEAIAQAETERDETGYLRWLIGTYDAEEPERGELPEGEE